MRRIAEGHRLPAGALSLVLCCAAGGAGCGSPAEEPDGEPVDPAAELAHTAQEPAEGTATADPADPEGREESSALDSVQGVVTDKVRATAVWLELPITFR